MKQKLKGLIGIWLIAMMFLMFMPTMTKAVDYKTFMVYTEHIPLKVGGDT